MSDEVIERVNEFNYLKMAFEFEKSKLFENAKNSY